MKSRYEFEQKYYQQGYQHIIGLDEAGRGPMAGELVVAGVVFKEGFYDERINDSKQLTEKKREELYDIVIENALFYNVVVFSSEEVDQLDVYHASQKGMEMCVNACHLQKLYALTDAMPIAFEHHEHIIKGDAKSISIAAASILAKVTRDRLMKLHAKEYPEYGFEKHKGYVTKLHKQKLNEIGPCPIHRKSFKPVQEAMKIQLSLKI